MFNHREGSVKVFKCSSGFFCLMYNDLLVCPMYIIIIIVLHDSLFPKWRLCIYNNVTTQCFFYTSWFLPVISVCLCVYINLWYMSVSQSVQSLSHVQLFATPWSQHTRPPCPSPAPGVYSNSCPLSWWCHPAISSSVVPFSSCPQSLSASGSFPMSQLFTWGGQSTGVSASVLSMNTQDWSPLGWTGWTSLQSKGLSRVFSNINVHIYNQS